MSYKFASGTSVSFIRDVCVGQRINLQKTETRSGEPILPRSPTFVPHVGRNLVTQLPVKDIQPVTMRSCNEVNQHDQAWMAEVYDTLYVDCETEKHPSATWSSYHSARSDTVVQLGKCINALLPLFHEYADDSTLNGTVEKDTTAPPPIPTPCVGGGHPLYALAKDTVDIP